MHHEIVLPASSGVAGIHNADGNAPPTSIEIGASDGRRRKRLASSVVLTPDTISSAPMLKPIVPSYQVGQGSSVVAASISSITPAPIAIRQFSKRTTQALAIRALPSSSSTPPSSIAINRLEWRGCAMMMIAGTIRIIALAN
jgi:hypothetical protein